VKVSTGVYASNLIPGNDVTDSLGDLKVTVRADPSFAIVGICADASLSRVFDSALDFGSSQTETNGIQI
jgi:hypothetical protein